MIKLFQSILICTFFICGIAQAEITTSGNQLSEVINSLKVEEKWQKGKVINCKTGEAFLQETEKYQSKKLQRLTHCGCFVYGVAVALNIPNDSLPPHPEGDKDFIPALSNKQADWYAAEGAKYGWKFINDKDAGDIYMKAQELANEGYLVIASYKNANPRRAGHTAVVVPSDKSIDKIKSEGPSIAQAGNRNFSCVSLKRGFKNRKGAFEDNNIKFYYYNKVTN